MNDMLAKYFDTALQPLAEPVQRLAYTGSQQMDTLVLGRKPVILTGALESWPAFTTWNPQYFRERWGDRSLPAHETKWEGQVPYLSLNAEKATKKTLSEFVEGASGPDYDLYVHQLEAAKSFPGSDADLTFGDLIEQAPGATALKPNVWMGTPGTRSGLHFDSADNLIAMFYGGKAFMLVDPSAPKQLYPFHHCPTKSQIDPAKIDWARFPQLRQAKIYLDVLRPGELLFLPYGWWHYFTALELTINANCWFYWKSVSYPGQTALLSPYLRYLRRCGPSYVLHFFYQLLWYGMLGRPHQRHALSPPPHGARIWAIMVRNLKRLTTHAAHKA